MFYKERLVLKSVALLTGRGNNTLRDKNILEVNGRPLLYYPANAARKSLTIDDWYCSSEDENILNIAQTLNYKKIVRPKELALPTSQHYDAIVHALSIMEKEDNVPDILVVLLANNVTVKSKWIDDCVNIMRNDYSISSVIPVYQDNDHHPIRAKKIDGKGNLEIYDSRLIKDDISTNRQDLEPCFFPAHNFWVLNVQNLYKNRNDGQKPWGFMGNEVKPYLIDESIDIHHEIDLYIASQWIKENYTD